MSQVPVKWTAESFLKEQRTTLHRIPVVPLSALREVVKELHDGYTGDFSAYRWALKDLLASLGEVGK